MHCCMLFEQLKLQNEKIQTAAKFVTMVTNSDAPQLYL